MESINRPLRLDKAEPNPWGFSMKGILPLGRCRTCGGTFKRDKKKGYICPKHRGRPERFIITVYYQGERIRRATTLDGKTLRCFADAHALLRQAENEKESHKFDPAKWKAKDRIDYSFSHQIDRWYSEKFENMKDGKLAPSYVPKLFTYIKHYFLPYFGDKDLREIRSTKDFSKQLSDGLYRFRNQNNLTAPKKLSLKYQDNILKALRGFFLWLKNEEKLINEDQMPVFKFEEVPEHEPQVISPETQAKLLDLIPDEHKPIFTFLFHQGCRPSEARALKWKDIIDDMVTIRRTWSDSVLREQTKTKKIRHNLLFGETLKALPPRSFNEQFVFTHGKIKKRHYSHDFLNKIFNTAVRQLNLGIELYEATKHSFGYYMLNKLKVSKEQLKDWYGHKSIRTTERYAKLQVVEAFREVQERKSNVMSISNRHQTATDHAGKP